MTYKIASVINMFMNISITTKVQDAIFAIDAGSVEPISIPGDGYVYLFDTSQKELANLRYTRFNKETGVALDGWQVRFSRRHTIVEALFNPLPRSEHPPFALEIPNRTFPEADGSIIPGCYYQ